MIVYKCDYKNCTKEQERINDKFIKVKHGIDFLFCSVDHLSWWIADTLKDVPTGALRISIASSLFESQAAEEYKVPEPAPNTDPECCNTEEHCDTCTCGDDD